VTGKWAAPAKINLWLLVGARQPSGFHDVDTLFCALDLADTVSLASRPPGSGLELRSSFEPPLAAMPDLGPVPANLAVRAAAGFLHEARLPADLAIHLVKRIPTGGGLGGGSADAGAVLRALDALHPGALSPDQLHALAARLGSDVPFCASGLTLAHGRDRGERLVALAPLPSRAVLLAFPPLHVSTAAAYGWLADDRARRGESADARLLHGPPPTLGWDEVAARARNDFEAVVFRRHPELARVRDILARHGARPALLAGSGSTLFGVYDDDASASAAADEVHRHESTVRTVTTRTRAR
jgi:4-diphosphocytidyl-2-C-methyl-D-erythritol kinase